MHRFLSSKKSVSIFFFLSSQGDFNVQPRLRNRDQPKAQTCPLKQRIVISHMGFTPFSGHFEYTKITYFTAWGTLFCINYICFGCSVVVAILSFCVYVFYFLNLYFPYFHHGGRAPNYVGQRSNSFPERQRFLANSSQEVINPSILLQSSTLTPFIL